MHFHLIFTRVVTVCTTVLILTLYLPGRTPTIRRRGQGQKSKSTRSPTWPPGLMLKDPSLYVPFLSRTMATPIFDSDLFYRITNAALGQSFSLDVFNPLGGANGEVNITPTGPFSGQSWQILSNSSTSNGEFYLSNAFTGARMKLDLSVANAIYTPFLKNITTTYDQTWLISQVNNDTYSLAPSILGGSQALTISNDIKQPFLADIGGSNQQWQLTPLAKINDASFSLSALFPTSTTTMVCLHSMHWEPHLTHIPRRHHLKYRRKLHQLLLVHKPPLPRWRLHHLYLQLYLLRHFTVQL